MDNELILESLTIADVTRMKALVKYANFPLGAVAAAVIAVAEGTVVAVAERLGVREIATIDHRHSRAVKSSRGGHFTLLP